MNKNIIFVSTGRTAGRSYPAHDLLEGYAVTFYDLHASRERESRNPNSPTDQANRGRTAERLRILEAKEQELRQKVEALIEMCETPDEREMLRMRYMMLMDWTSIARILYGDEPGFIDGKEYRHRALCLHQDVMRNLENKIRNKEENKV